MKVSDFFGRRVLDKKANEIGKVVDLVIKPKKGIITTIIISTSDFGLTRKNLEIKISDLQSGRLFAIEHCQGRIGSQKGINSKN